MEKGGNIFKLNTETYDEIDQVYKLRSVSQKKNKFETKNTLNFSDICQDIKESSEDVTEEKYWNSDIRDCNRFSSTNGYSSSELSVNGYNSSDSVHISDNNTLSTTLNTTQEAHHKENESSVQYFRNKKIQLYKTEFCRSHIEIGYCKYGVKCQFAHDASELRKVNRHPRYKTETCHTFWEKGSCPYGKRCCFIHTNKYDKEDGSSEIVRDIVYNKNETGLYNKEDTDMYNVNIQSSNTDKQASSYKCDIQSSNTYKQASSYKCEQKEEIRLQMQKHTFLDDFYTPPEQTNKFSNNVSYLHNNKCSVGTSLQHNKIHKDMCDTLSPLQHNKIHKDMCNTLSPLQHNKIHNNCNINHNTEHKTLPLEYNSQCSDSYDGRYNSTTVNIEYEFENDMFSIIDRSVPLKSSESISNDYMDILNTSKPVSHSQCHSISHPQCHSISHSECITNETKKEESTQANNKTIKLTTEESLFYNSLLQPERPRFWDANESLLWCYTPIFYINKNIWKYK